MEKESNKLELLYRLDKRNPLMVLIDFIKYGFFLLVPALPTAIYYDGWMRILGILGSALLIWLLYSVIFFNYVEIYKDKIVIDRFIFGNQIIKPENIIHCRTFERAFLPAHVEIVQKTQHRKAKMTIIAGLTHKQADEIEAQIDRIIL
ncbi:hypothetical protein [Campylobacter sp. CCUG 57310]|uniref:hypothetical protein n=1 Tax=Campylobacter sp. CCUG 57310 TaxID=2517362 RepID=UPI0015661107|nr:hypothetical protein [Campylobacter sp. CCUG 57310]QKF92738.1 putative membrane protein [Campylobacter sp. CCUG 57310]